MRHNLNKESENTDRWLVSYADFITLLFAFFVVMYSVSQVNEGKFKILSETLTDAFVQPERSLQPIQIGEVNKADTITSGENTYPTDYMGEPATAETDQSFKELKDDFKDSLKELIEANLVKIRSNQDWIEIEMRNQLLFKSGEDKLSQAAVVLINTLSEPLKNTVHSLRIRGYTDNIPIQSQKFSSNWALSSARAVAVVHLLQQAGIAPNRMAPEGYGEHQPIVSNDTKAGQSSNRRVVLAISRFPPTKSELERAAFEVSAIEGDSSQADVASTNLPVIVDEPEPQISLIRAADGSLIIRARTDETTDDQTNNNQ